MEPSSNLRLFGTWTSPYVHAVQLGLKLKGLQYEYVEEDLRNKSPSLLLYNPIYKKVPVLLHGGHPLAESIVILQYIDETWEENPLLPKDPYERAVVLFWCHFVGDKLAQALRTILRTSGEVQKAAVGQLHESLKLIEGELRDGFFRGKRFFGGEEIGALDIILGVDCCWVSVMEGIAGEKFIDQQSCPFLYSWFQDFTGLEDVKQILPTTEKLLEYAEAIRSRAQTTS